MMIKIGPYTISEWPDDDWVGADDYWIQHEDGEGMGTSEEKLIKMVKDFWKTEF